MKSEPKPARCVIVTGDRFWAAGIRWMGGTAASGTHEAGEPVATGMLLPRVSEWRCLGRVWYKAGDDDGERLTAEGRTTGHPLTFCPLPHTTGGEESAEGGRLNHRSTNPPKVDSEREEGNGPRMRFAATSGMRPTLGRVG